MPIEKTSNCLAFEQHDHRRCQLDLMAAAHHLCRVRGMRLTRRREQVLQILLRSHQPMGAYEILALINREESGGAVAPPIVYRALDFLLDAGMVHRIECRNAFIPCVHPGHEGAAQFLICNGCEKVAELEHPVAAIRREANQLGFCIDHPVIEITGICAECQADGR